MGFLEIEIFPYKVLFKSIRTHVMLDSPISCRHKDKYEDDLNMILNALKSGRCFIANHYYGNAKGFRFFAEYKGNTYSTGDTIKITDGRALLKVFTPKACKIKLVYNGEIVSIREGIDTVWDASSEGIYRVECWIEDKGWIFSNHIRIENEK